MKKLSVIIINYGTAEMTEKVIKNFLAREKNLDFEIILIDNKSKEELPKKIFLNLGVKVIFNKSNLGFAKAVNQGIGVAQGEYILLLNSDVFIKKEAISTMIRYLEKDRKIGLIGPQMLFPDNKFQPSFGNYPNFWREFLRIFSLNKILSGSTVERNTLFKKINLQNAREVDWLTGGCLLIRHKLIHQIGILDENYFLGGEDIDFCFRAQRSNWKTVYFPKAQVVHLHGASSGQEGTRSIFRLRFDRDGISYFFKKNFTKKYLSYYLIKNMNNFKIFIVWLENILKPKKRLNPIDATIAITYNCNSRCQMCNIWQIKNPPALSVKDFANLGKNLKYINLSGGEPFLHPDLTGIVKVIKKNNPKTKIIISTNGYASDLITAKMKEILAIDPSAGVRVSLDGKEKTHNKIRGINNIYKQAWETIDNLRKIGVNNLGISFTIMNDNVLELPAVYNLAREKKLELAIALVQNSDIYFNTKDNKINSLKEIEKSLNYVINQELKSWNLKKWGRAFYDYGLLYYARTGRRLLRSGAGFDSLFIDPKGEVYPSNLIAIKMGNIKNNNLDKIWQSKKVAEIRTKMIRENITESWIICTIRGEMKKHPLRIAIWIIKNKFFLIQK